MSAVMSLWGGLSRKDVSPHGERFPSNETRSIRRQPVEDISEFLPFRPGDGGARGPESDDRILNRECSREH